jgi:hypothetical protein
MKPFYKAAVAMTAVGWLVGNMWFDGHTVGYILSVLFLVPLTAE